MMSQDEKPDFIGPHEGRELSLMLTGKKKLSVFVEPLSSNLETFPEDEFDRLVSEGHLVKRVSKEAVPSPKGRARIRRVLYAVPEDEWRIDAYLFIQDLYSSLGGWRADLDRAIGILLGYDREDIEKFVARHE